MQIKPTDMTSAAPIEAIHYEPPLLANWTQQNFDATYTSAANLVRGVSAERNSLRLKHGPVNVGNSNNLRALLRPIPGTRYRVTARIRRHHLRGAYDAIGLVMRDSASGRSNLIGQVSETGGFGRLAMTSDNTYSGISAWGGSTFNSPEFWIQFEWDGTNYRVKLSYDGYNFAQQASGTDPKFGFLTNNPTHLGFGINNNDASNTTGFERMAELLSWREEILP